MKKRTEKAFTLAEVLITLTIIGVVSALTIPTLVQKTNKQEYVSALQKAYSVLSQATQQIIAENGNPKADENGESWLKDSKSMYEMYKKHLHNSKECGSVSGCFRQKIKTLNNSSYRIWDSNTIEGWEKLILADGMQVMFIYNSKECSRGDNSDTCAQIYLDLNGEKTPNKLGRDVFQFILKKDGLYPTGCETGCDSEGWQCACKVLREGKMDY